MKKLKVIQLKALAFLFFLGIFLFNAQVFASRTTTKHSSGLSRIKTQMYSDSESDSGGENKKKCVNVECNKKVVTGMPPYQITSTYYGHYDHCTGSDKGNCNDSSCNTECDATVIT